MPLDAVVALSFDDGSDILEADGLDVSPSGLSLRANFVPEVGTRLSLRFHCPPHDEPVRALGEVVWGTWQSRDEGLFGMEFLELDTKSATTIRRLLSPEAPLAEPEKPRPRLASMRIDGLEVPIEAEVKRADPDCIVLEQDLTFLRLGRGVDVEVKGRGKTRGRIASIELRHGPLDVPTLVFGVLLDGARESAPSDVTSSRRAGRAPTLDQPFADPAAAGEHTPVERGPSVARRTAQALADAAWPDVDDAAPPPDEEAPAADSDDLDGAGVDTDATDAPEQLLRDDDPDAPPASYPLAARAAHAGAAAARLGRALRALGGRLREAYGRLRSPHSAEDGEVAPSPSPLLRIAHASGRISASLHQLFQRSAQPTKRRTTGAPARVVRAQSPKAQSKPTAEAKRPRNQRLYAAAFAIVGVGIGVYALAPRSGADRIRAGRFAAPVSAPEPVPMVTPIQVPASTATPAPEPMAAPTAVQGVTVPAAAAPAEPSAAEQPPAAPFGEPIIENGRTFVLRMSGPVRHIEGEARDDGFTVRVPGRLALDRAQPIANAHQAVARAMVLNRGEYAELTVDFRPGMRPKYQVVGKDNALEITLARP